MENITPQSWPRIVLKSIPELRDIGVDVSGLQEPSDDLELSDEALSILNKWMDELYELQVKEDMIA
ncbi:MAG: hypothetical protein R8G66_09300 [Cytophagales bacterium]|nr:hypothetical protein [Cytophagales bacterium]